MMTDFMEKISRMRLEYASCVATIRHEEENMMLELLTADSQEPNQGD